ncbi:hypothetical protein AM571_PC00475 (plasmid) [Rhizobium etli 8C-3]|uniref:Uncharacterized protein n=2 Tax=Rhizobium TaxID=379 RepID=A0A1L5PDK2_RHIET|nr:MULTISPECIES: hypothetical protein [Rhizobium]APO78213.1 hypothetical protein AM571_PC00475 [Rhizobium etli 8C-3]TCU40814.1 hypothetical protein EV129_10199 [Rhizobium azibense]
MTRDHFSARETPLQNGDIEICQRVFDHISTTHHITSDDERDQLASQIIYFYQHGVTNEQSLVRLIARADSDEDIDVRATQLAEKSD